MENLRSILPFVREYSSKVGTHLQPEAPLTRDNAVGNNIWMGNAIVATLKNGKIIRNSTASCYCTGSFFAGQYQPDEPIFIQIQQCPEEQDPEAYRQYIKWVVNDSPWADAFITKNINTILKRRVAVIKPGLEKWYRKEATIAIRMAWENYYNNRKFREIKLWWELAQKVDPDLSYLAGKVMFYRDNNGKISQKGGESGHTPINYSRNVANYHLTGWYRRHQTKTGWSCARKNGDLVGKIKEIAQGVNASSVYKSPWSLERELATSYDPQKFIEAMYSELPALEGMKNG